MQANLYNYHECAEQLGISPVTLRRWVQQGRIRHLKIGKYVRFRREHIDEFLAQAEVEPVRRVR